MVRCLLCNKRATWIAGKPVQGTRCFARTGIVAVCGNHKEMIENATQHGKYKLKFEKLEYMK